MVKIRGKYARGKLRNPRKYKLPPALREYFRKCGSIGYAIGRKIDHDNVPDTPNMDPETREFFIEASRMGNQIRSAAMMHSKHCDCCGKEFVTDWKDTKYCSNACRQFEYRKRRDAKIMKEQGEPL